MRIKELILSILVILSVSSGLKSQQFQTLGSSNTRIQQRGQFLNDSAFWTTRRNNATFTPPLAGAINFQPADQRLYFYDSLSRRWAKILIPTDFLGTIYNNSSWTSLSDFVNVGSTVSVVANHLQFSGGANTLFQTLQVPKPSMLEHWTVSTKVATGTKTSTSWGFGIGVKTINTFVGVDLVGSFDMTNGANSGKLSITANTVAATSISAVSFTAGDIIQLTATRNVDTFTVTAYNITTNSLPVSVSYLFSFNLPGIYLPNTGNFSIFSLGGTFTVNSLTVGSMETVNPTCLIIGDSKTQGHDALNKYYRYGDRLGFNFPSTDIHAGNADRTVEVSAAVPEIISLHPYQVMIAIGSNDIRSGEDSASIKTRYDSIVVALSGAGILVYHLLPFFETAEDQLWLKNFIQRTYPANRVIDTYTPTSLCTNCLSPDGTHPNTTGNLLIYNTIIDSYKLIGGNNSRTWGFNDMLAYSNSSVNNGLSISGNNFVLGQDPGQSGNPAALLSSREIPLNGSSFGFTGTNNGQPQSFTLIDQSDDFAEVFTNSNSFTRFNMTNSNAGNGAGAGILMGNNVGHVAFLFMGSSTNGFVQDGVLLSNGNGAGAVYISNVNGPIAFGNSQTQTSGEFSRFTNSGHFLLASTTDNGAGLQSSNNLSVGVMVSASPTLTLGTKSNCVFSGATTTWTLPTVTSKAGWMYFIKNRGSGTITLNSSAGGNDIYNTSAVNTIPITAGQSCRIVNDGTFWLIENLN